MGISYGIEGNEGAGKSLLVTLTRILFQETTGFPVMASVEPGVSELGDEIRSILRDLRFAGMHAITNTLLYSASRSENYFHRETPFLNENPHGILLKDRTWLSTVALQTVDGADIDYIMAVQRPFIDIPNKFVIVDIPVEESVARIFAAYKRENSNREPDWRDKQDHKTLSAIRDNYLNFAIHNPEKCLIFDCFDDPWNKAAKIKLDAIKTLGLNEGVVINNVESTKMLTTFAEEAKLIIDTHKTRVYTSEQGYLKTFDIDSYRSETEAARKELGYPGIEELRQKMHYEWQKLGIENISYSCERNEH